MVTAQKIFGLEITEEIKICERGNGWPQNGDEIILDDGAGNIRLMRLLSSGDIQTSQTGAGDHILATVAPSSRSWDDLTQDEQDEAWESLPHA